VLGAPGMPPPGRGTTTRRRKIAFGAVFATAAIAFVIAVAALTLPELVAGGSVGKNDGRTTLFGGKKSDDRNAKEQAPQDTTEEEQQPTTPEEEQQPTTPEEETTPLPEEEPPAEVAPQQQAPAPGEPLPETTPVPPTTQP
jgi:outer membrane biosynthesis protein TonB